MSPPLAGLRVVVTTPPVRWFGGIDFNFSVEMSAELRALGASVFEVDVGAIVSPNPHYASAVVEALRSFRPDVAIALPNALYALHCRTTDRKNIFRDVLEVPTIMLWDHGLFQLPKICLEPLPRSPGEATTGAIRRIRDMIDHPLYHHYSPDTGHIEALDRIGVLSRRKVRFFLQPAYPNFVKHGYHPPPTSAFRTRLAFAGNVYPNASSELSFGDEPRLMEIQERVLSAKKQRLTEPLWELLTAQVSGLDAASRRRLRLTPDSTFFWSFVYDEVEVVGNTRVRLDVLTALKQEYEFYGNFVEPGAAGTLRKRYNINVQRSLDYFTELPLLFMNSELIVDVIHLGYNTGISPKVMGCLACGGLVLFDYKADFQNTLGDVAAQVMYRSVDELNALVDRFLSDSRLRRDVSRCLQHHALTTHSFGSLCQRILVDEPVWRR